MWSIQNVLILVRFKYIFCQVCSKLSFIIAQLKCSLSLSFLETPLSVDLLIMKRSPISPCYSSVGLSIGFIESYFISGCIKVSFNGKRSTLIYSMSFDLSIWDCLNNKFFKFHLWVNIWLHIVAIPTLSNFDLLQTKISLAHIFEGGSPQSNDDSIFSSLSMKQQFSFRWFVN